MARLTKEERVVWARIRKMTKAQLIDELSRMNYEVAMDDAADFIADALHDGIKGFATMSKGELQGEYYDAFGESLVDAELVPQVHDEAGQ